MLAKRIRLCRHFSLSRMNGWVGQISTACGQFTVTRPVAGHALVFATLEWETDSTSSRVEGLLTGQDQLQQGL